MAAERSVKNEMESDPLNVRQDFPILSHMMNGKRLAFLDTAASAQKPRSVIEAMSAVMEDRYANIHRGLYELSQDLTTRYETVRRKVANFINAESEKEIVFTRNATESINLVAQTWARTNLKAGDEIILSEMEHHANIVPWQILRDQIGIVIRTIPVDDWGVLDFRAFSGLVNEKTKMIGIVHVSNALGTINPIKKMIHTARAYNPDIKVLVDGSQAVVHGRSDVQDLDADFYVFTGHKLYGPTGIGVLYGKYDILQEMPVYQGGGDMIETVTFDQTTYKEAPFKFEAGTPPIVEVIGLGEAIDYIRDIGRDRIMAHEKDMLDYATAELEKIEGLKLFGTAPDKTGIISFIMDDIHPSDIGMVLDQCGVAIRSGHHCCMPLMERYGLDSTSRASIGLYTNKEDIDQLVLGLQKVREMFT